MWPLSRDKLIFFVNACFFVIALYETLVTRRQFIVRWPPMRVRTAYSSQPFIFEGAAYETDASAILLICVFPFYLVSRRWFHGSSVVPAMQHMLSAMFATQLLGVEDIHMCFVVAIVVGLCVAGWQAYDEGQLLAADATHEHNE